MMDEAKAVKRAVRRQISKIESLGDSGPGKARLANLRKAVGKRPQDFPDLWGTFLEDLPEPEYETKSITPQEEAVFNALTLYALAQQGNSPLTHSMNSEGISFGAAAGKLTEGDEDEEERIRAKLKSLIASKNTRELAEHLRRLIQLMKAKDIKLDYPELAEDIYWFHFPKARENVQLKWARDFIRTLRRENAKKSEEKKNNQEEK